MFRLQHSCYIAALQSSGHHTEKELLTRLQTGDEGAFTELYHMHHQRLYFFALRFLEEADAKEIVADAFVQLWNKQTDFDDPSALMRFLFVTVRNRCLNAIRHAKHVQSAQADLLYQIELSREEDLTNEALATELITLIHEEIEKLAPRVREVFLLSFIEGMKPAAIAERLQISVQTVKNQKVTALRVLQAAVGSRALILYLLLTCDFSRAVANLV